MSFTYILLNFHGRSSTKKPAFYFGLQIVCKKPRNPINFCYFCFINILVVVPYSNFQSVLWFVADREICLLTLRNEVWRHHSFITVITLISTDNKLWRNEWVYDVGFRQGLDHFMSIWKCSISFLAI